MSEDDTVLQGARIKKETRDEWREFVNESDEFSSVAQMIRTAVSRLIEEEESDDRVVERLDMLEEDINRVLRVSQNVDTEIHALREELDDAEEIAKELLVYIEENEVDIQ